MIETAARREKEEWDIEVRDFSEAVIGYLQEKGVDLADPDWAIDERDVPFTSQFAKVTRVPAQTPLENALPRGLRSPRGGSLREGGWSQPG